MRKIILCLVLVCVFIGGSLFAADGDLKVNGSVGIGIDPTTYKLDVNGTSALRGNVGIGTTPSTYNLDVNGTSALRGTVWTSGPNIEVCGLSTGNNYAYIDFRGDDTYTDYGLRLLRGNGGPNTSSELSHRGIGALVIQTVDSAPLNFRTASADRVAITSSGNVGIGTTAPAKKLHVIDPTGTWALRATRQGTGTTGFGGAAELVLHTSDDMQDGFGPGLMLSIQDNGAGPNYIGGVYATREGSDTSGKLHFLTRNGADWNSRMAIDKRGYVGVGTGTPANILSVLQYSATDPVADSWTAYPCDRTTKDVIRTLPNQSGALDRLLAVDLYEWKRKPLVSDEEIKTDVEKVMTPDELERRRQDLSAEKSKLPKFQAIRVGVMLDDPNIPDEIVSLDGAGKKGLDLVGYIGLLHATIKELALRVQELEKR
ncbi:MAG: hypothetical protein A2V86_09015 [Deltaproteobacteria bacterium RBG_16_49_23]|nr:MAG: hypothetical protein A2V86_09015 [Deltaproteobacteria bacterium RBG_16_49_23]